MTLIVEPKVQACTTNNATLRDPYSRGAILREALRVTITVTTLGRLHDGLEVTGHGDSDVMLGETPRASISCLA